MRRVSLDGGHYRGRERSLGLVTIALIAILLTIPPATSPTGSHSRGLGPFAATSNGPPSSAPPVSWSQLPTTPFSGRIGESLMEFNTNSTNGTAPTLVMFGGATTKQVFGDTWTSTNNGTSWTEVCAPGWGCPTPSPRWGGSFIGMDADQALFGGCSVPIPPSSNNIPTCPAGAALNDTWQLSVSPGGGVDGFS